MTKATMTWIKSTYCANGTCVEVARDRDLIAMRDGKRPDEGMLRFSRSDWHGFLEGVQAGDFSR